MIKSIVRCVRGCITLSLLSLNLIIYAGFLLTPVTFLKLISPTSKLRLFFLGCAHKLVNLWVDNAVRIRKLCLPTEVVVSGDTNLREDEWYLLICNHQSWVDILTLNEVFNRKIPVLKYFLKRELVWVPLVGWGCWALEFPFMRRYSSSYLKRHPEKKGKDLIATQKACEKYRYIPTTIMNYVEGTRFKPHKHRAQQSPYKHLLKAKAGGAGYVLSAMGDTIQKVLNVTIVYHGEHKTFWDYCCGRIKKVSVHIEVIDITAELRGNYVTDNQFRAHFQRWLNEIWIQKDIKISELKAKETHG